MSFPTEVLTGLPARFKEYPRGSGDWCVAVDRPGDLTGRVVQVVQRNGAGRNVLLTELLYPYRDRRHPALYRKEDVPAETVHVPVPPIVRETEARAVPSPPARVGPREHEVPAPPAGRGDWMEEGERAAVAAGGYDGPALSDLVAGWGQPSPQTLEGQRPPATREESVPEPSPEPSPAPPEPEPTRSPEPSPEPGAAARTMTPEADLKALVRRERARAFRPEVASGIPDSRVLGGLVARYFGWDAAEVIETSAAALQECNHEAAALAVESLLGNLDALSRERAGGEVPSEVREVVPVALAHYLAHGPDGIDHAKVLAALRWIGGYDR